MIRDRPFVVTRPDIQGPLKPEARARGLMTGCEFLWAAYDAWYETWGRDMTCDVCAVLEDVLPPGALPASAHAQVVVHSMPLVPSIHKGLRLRDRRRLVEVAEIVGGLTLALMTRSLGDSRLES